MLTVKGAEYEPISFFLQVTRVPTVIFFLFLSFVSERVPAFDTEHKLGLYFLSIVIFPLGSLSIFAILNGADGLAKVPVLHVTSIFSLNFLSGVSLSVAFCDTEHKLGLYFLSIVIFPLGSLSIFAILNGADGLAKVPVLHVTSIFSLNFLSGVSLSVPFCDFLHLATS